MKMIWVRTTFPGFHRQLNAPDEVSFLRFYHRHVFHVRVGVEVEGTDHNVDLFILQRALNEYLTIHFQDHLFDSSCEQIATTLLQKFNAVLVEVSEDGENGATVDITNTKPTDQIRKRCFVGVEAEGPFQKRLTLFVPGSCTPEEFRAAVQRLDIYCKGRKPERAYIGAGNDCDFISEQLFEAVRMVYLPEDITIEVSNLDFADHQYLKPSLPFIGTVVTHTADNIDGDGGLGERSNIYYKEIGADHIFWRNKYTTFTTALNDPLFLSDRTVY